MGVCMYKYECVDQIAFQMMVSYFLFLSYGLINIFQPASNSTLFVALCM